MEDPPPPPPPHGEKPRAKRAGGLPDGNYDIFVIPPSSAGSGFLYLPSLNTQRNSFLAGCACTATAFFFYAVAFPVAKEWFYDTIYGGGSGVLMMVIGVGVVSWALGKTQGEGVGPTPSAGGYFKGNSTPPKSSSDAPPKSRSGRRAPSSTEPDPEPEAEHDWSPPPHSRSRSSRANAPPPTPPPEPNKDPGSDPPRQPAAEPKKGPEPAAPEPQAQSPPPKPKSTWQKTSQTPDAKSAWEKAREETRKREEERKRAAEIQRRRDEIQRERERLREKETVERLEREWKEKKTKEDQELRAKQVKDEADRKAQREKERREREAREALLQAAKDAREAKEALEKTRREEKERKEREEKEAKERKENAEKEAAQREAEIKAAQIRAAEMRAEDAERARAAAEARAAEATAARKAAGESAKASNVSSNASKKPPMPTARTERDDDAYSFRPYDRPRTQKSSSGSVYSDDSYAPSASTARTTPPASVRGAYSTKDPDKVIIKGVYSFNNAFMRTPISQLISGQGNVTDGLILRITTEGLFIDDDVRGVPQREWDVKAWTLKLCEVSSSPPLSHLKTKD